MQQYKNSNFSLNYISNYYKQSGKINNSRSNTRNSLLKLENYKSYEQNYEQTYKSEDELKKEQLNSEIDFMERLIGSCNDTLDELRQSLEEENEFYSRLAGISYYENNSFPSALYDIDKATALKNYQLRNLLDILIRLGIEDSYGDIDDDTIEAFKEQFLLKVKDGSYIDAMAALSGNSKIDEMILDNLITIVSKENELRDANKFDIVTVKALKDSIVTDRGSLKNEITGVLDDDSYTAINRRYNDKIRFGEFPNKGGYLQEHIKNYYNIDYLSDDNRCDFLYCAAFLYTTDEEIEKFIADVEAAMKNGTLEQFSQRVVNEYKMKSLCLTEDELKSFYDGTFTYLKSPQTDSFGNKVADNKSTYIDFMIEKYNTIMKNKGLNKAPNDRTITVDDYQGNYGKKNTLSSIKGNPNELTLLNINDITKGFYFNVEKLKSDNTKQLESDIAYMEDIIEQFKNIKIDKELDLKIDPKDYDELSTKNQLGILLVLDYRIVNVMSDEEKKKYVYLYNKCGAQTAKDYYKTKEDEFNSRAGMFSAIKFVNFIKSDPNLEIMLQGCAKSGKLSEEARTNLLAAGMAVETVDDFSDWFFTTGKGFFDGVDTFLDGLVDVIFADGKMDIDDYEKMYIGLLLSDDKILSGTYEISSGIGNMAIPMLVATLVSLYTANPTAFYTLLGKDVPLSAVVGSGLFGLSAMGNSTEQGLQSGMNFSQARIYGLMSFLSEGGLQLFVGGIPVLSGKSPAAQSLVTNMFKEGIEEMSQDVLDVWFRYLVTGEFSGYDSESIIKSGIYGFITAGILGGGEVMLDKINISVDDINSESVEIIRKAEKEGLKIEYTAEMLMDPNVAQQAVDKAKNGNIEVLEVDFVDYESYTRDQKSDEFDKLKADGKLSSNFAPNRDLFIKYFEIFMNPKFCDLETGKIKWPQAEGSKEFSHLTDQELFELGTTKGIDSLVALGAEIIDISNNSGDLIGRVSNAENIGSDSGEYFGNTTDDMKSRELMPYTTENGKLYSFEFTGFDGTGQTIEVNGETLLIGEDCEIVCMKTHTAPFYNDVGGAEQFVFYLVDKNGNILKNGDMLYKLNSKQLRNLGILNEFSTEYISIKEKYG